MKTETLRVRNVVDATRFWVHGCEPGRVSDGSRLALCQTLSIECKEFDRDGGDESLCEILAIEATMFGNVSALE